MKITPKSSVLGKFVLSISVLVIGSMQTMGQSKDSIQVGGNILVTNNGMSPIPTLSLGKPAAIFELDIKHKRWAFEPQFRFSLDGKPWSFVIWGRYRQNIGKKLALTLGAHPSFVFRSKDFVVSGVTKRYLTSVRFTAVEFAPIYIVSPHFNFGVYYLYSHGWDEGATNNTHFATINANWGNVKIAPSLYFRAQPQLYFLKLDKAEGYYVTSAFTLSSPKTAFVLSSVVNKKIQSTIPGKDFVWNVALIYFFGKKYFRI
ncbi:MAG: hypothetical protein K2P88_07535 [Chitinophagaceae bacterium]|nr:hypothetical protein [Chitinophagaceae bacterium]